MVILRRAGRKDEEDMVEGQTTVSERQTQVQELLDKSMSEPGVADVMGAWEKIQEVWIPEVTNPPRFVIGYGTGANPG